MPIWQTSTRRVSSLLPTNYAFGMSMKERSFQAESYRYGFNGQERDRDIDAEGNHNTAEFWEYSAVIGRRWNTDPAFKKYPEESPYLAFHNNPISISDPKGDDPPIDFKKHKGVSGDLYLPQKAKVELFKGKYFNARTNKRIDTKDGDVRAFSIGNQRFTANYDSKGKFIGYRNTATKKDYKNPDITIKSGETINGLELRATFDVKDVPASGLQVVQTFYGTPSALGISVGSPYVVGGTTYDAFVDGGHNSPYVHLQGYSPAHPKKPHFYPNFALRDVNHGNMSWNNDSGSITAYDEPTAMKHFPFSQFETSIIATNYMGTNEDVFLGTFKWGYKSNGTSPSSQTIKLSNMSSVHIGIIKQDYPKYKFF